MNLNLEKEIKSYSELTKQYELTLSKFALFFKTFGTEGQKFIQKSNKLLEEYFAELRKEPSNTTNNITFLSFYNDIHRAFQKYGEIFNNINTNISDKLSEIYKKMISNHNTALEKLIKLSNILAENKIKLEKFKNNYFNACKVVIEQENKIIKLRDNKKLKEEDFLKNNETLGKYVSNAESLESTYKSELNKYNKLIETGEEAYGQIIKIFKDEYKNKLSTIFNCFEELKNNINTSNAINNELHFKTDKACKCLNIERDLNIFSEQNNYYNENKKRFFLERFLDYKLFMIDDKNKKNNSKERMNINKDIMKKYKDIINLGKTKGEDKSQNKELIELKTEEEKNINEYLISLLNEENKIDEKKFETIDEYINKNPENIKLVMNILLNQFQKSSFIKLSNLDNLNLLSKILSSIITIAMKNKNVYEVIYIVIFLAEKTIFLNKENIYNKCYLNNILSKNTFFSDQKFWMNLIIKKVEMMGEVIINMQIEKIEREKNEMKNDKVFSKVKGIFSIGKSKESEMIENEILFGQLYDEKLPIFSVQVIDEYIDHFSNFNFQPKIASKLILELADKYKFEGSFVTYFMAKLNSNFCLTENSLQEEIKNINYDKLYFNSANNTIIKYKHVFDTNLRGLIYSLGFLELKDFPNLFALNKNYNKYLVKIIYKNILIKYHEMDIKTHLSIWKILLDYYQIKKTYNYSEIKKELGIDASIEEIMKSTSIEDFQNSKDIIDLDIVRTSFTTNKLQNQLRIRNILKSIRQAKNNLKYCQGMNYIAAFLLNITNDEEEAFYLFLSIFDGTDYGKLFVDDLAKLKKYFYVFGRLLNVLLPELDFYLKDNKIDVSYFVSPWFITLFTNTFPNIKDKNNPKILLRILDLFFFSGWKSIIKIGISLLKNYENTIMTLTFEELLQFLISNILKSDFFQKENFDQLMRIKINFKIQSSLIADIENEYEMKKKLDKFGINLSTNRISD